ncbi:FAD-binding and (Fe-S)-binding domain-containing protein [Flavisolibacter ginsenosidimutans]|uniref:FAD-binding oxidoreductase n=1 Tax=Flavisolibacter ginsenosidimutans TaxID=661481 RepID=A0A5B8UCS8_9BACT|nr:FAD-binding and (Fe-S)-binding domain-containing protein [Flavisolibacter ginsenosidimutans]QEC54461.1 FAD-binding oxidoreductase [Flavisolibacter ginsenosidimutans]
MSIQHTKDKVKGNKESEKKPEVNIQTDSKSKVNGQVLDPRFQTKYSIGVDAKALQKELKKAVSGEVRFDDGSRALYSTDASNYRQIPIGVVLPKTEDDIINTINICRKYGAPILSRGGGTSLAGQCCNVAVMMDMSKYYNNVLHIDKEKKLVTVQPGIVLDEMRHTTERKAGLTFGPDPATHDHCTIGGMLGNNSCGVHSVMAQFEGYGARTSDNTESITVVTYDGLKIKAGPTSDDEYNQIQKEGGRKAEIYRKMRELRDKYTDLIKQKFPNIPRRVSGYNLPALLPENGFNVAHALVGSESTLVTITEATMKLITTPKERSLLVLGYPSLPDAGYAVPGIMQHKPIGLEGLDDLLIEFMRRKGLNINDIPLLPKGNAWLMVEFGGDSKEDADNKAKALMDELKKKNAPPSMSLFDDPAQEKKLWEVRESGLGATAWVPGEPNGGPGWEDSAVDPKNVGDYLKDLRALFDKYGYKPSIYGHFGQGCIHCRVGFDFLTKGGIEKYKQFTIEASHLVVKYGGSLSGEHGDGQARGDLLEIMYGKELVEAFKEFKRIWDPEWKMNPGKIVDTYGQTNDLRLGTDYNPPKLKTHFGFPDDAFSWERITLKCVGVGECRRHEGGTMCPSYMVTREEMHSTRGRSRLLYEMLHGDVLKGGWKDEHVKEALDLCLACKGCKGDCPVNVDMATYKSEFLSHYYERKLRPRTAYVFGWIYWWSRMASFMPGVFNFLMHAPFISNITKALAGIAPQRKMPKYAEQTFKSWFSNRQSAIGNQPQPTTHKQTVILWADTFNNYFLPQTLVAGVEVLEAAGFKVIVPKKSMCCGRPLYDFGMLNTAKRMLVDIMQTLHDEIKEGVPIVGLEPSCVAVFRDELHNLFPHDEQASRLSKQVFTLGEFLEKKAPDFKIPALKQKAIVHGHCHHSSIMKMDCEKKVLDKTGLDYEVLPTTCCGMAGYFGYEKGQHYDVSIKAGELLLLPKVREADEETIVIADGFSCREQIEQETDRKGMHLAQVLQMALHEKEAVKRPEKKYVDDMALKNPHKKRSGLLLLGVVVLSAGYLLWKAKRKE